MGTNQFPLAEDKKAAPATPPRTVPVESSSAAERKQAEVNLSSLYKTNDESPTLCRLLDSWYDETRQKLPVLTLQRGAVAFEEIRLASENFGRRRGRLPTVSLISDGHLSMRIARATFVNNFFGCAGYQVHDNPAGLDGVQLDVVLKEQHPDMIVLCSSDDEYPELLKKYGPLIDTAVPTAIKMIAGHPLAHKEMLTSMGIADFVHVGTNAITFFTNYKKKLGI